MLRASFTRSLEETSASDGAALIATVEAERAAAHRCLVNEMRTPRWQSMLHMLDAAAVLPPLRTMIAPTSEANDAAHSLLRKSWRRLERRVAAAPESSTGWHEVRKAAKSTRYAAETFEPLLGRDTRPLARNAERIQTRLGREQDKVIARGWLQDHAAPGPSLPPRRDWRSTTRLMPAPNPGTGRSCGNKPGNRLTSPCDLTARGERITTP